MSGATPDDPTPQDVRYLLDRLAIQDCLMRHARGVDRHDAELVNSCYHADAIVRHGNSGDRIRGADYGAWSNGAHDGRFALHSHNITNINCELDGDVAMCESYVITVFLAADQERTSVAMARYVDRLERRDGAWRIAARRAFVDIAFEADATYFGNPRGSRVDPGQLWTRQDLSYQRPMDLDAPGPQWT
jgi:hypothetical protein